MAEKKFSIGSRIWRLLLMISMSAVFVVGIIAVTGVLYLRNSTMQISGQLGETAAHDSSTALEKQITAQLSSLAKSKATLGNEKFDRIQTYIKMLKDSAEDMLAHPEQYAPLTVPRADPKNDGIVTAQFNSAENLDMAALSEEIGLMGNIVRQLEPIAAHNEFIVSIYLGTESGLYYIADDISGRKKPFFDPRERPWYITAKAAGGLSWSDVFDDADGRGLGITCASPYYDPQGNMLGVVSLGSVITFLSDIVLETKIGETGYAFVLNEKGQMIISPTIQKDADGKIIREDLLGSDNEQLRGAAERMVAGESGITRVMLDGQEYFMAYEPFSVVPWSFATLITVDEALRPAIQSEQGIIALKNSALYDIDSFIITMLCVFVALVLVIVLSISIFSRRFSEALTKPIAVLREGVGRIADGNLDYVIEVQTRDEIQDLSHSVNKMASDLKDHIASLQRVTADKERIGAELNVATRIQASMLPCIFPAFPDRVEFDIYATMLPAKEVGGDFYDFFLINERKLAVVIADVSGKGVPAALFMVIAKTLIKNNAQHGKSPEEVFETVNSLLCENNEADMFVTAFLGYLDIPAGTFTYVNAGHNPPLLKRGGGQFEWLPTKPGFVLAGMEGMRYKQDEIQLNPGDMLYMYTDGVTEAVDRENRLFTEARLLDVLDAGRDCGLKELLVTVKREIDKFADGAEQADDITMLALKITGGAK